MNIKVVGLVVALGVSLTGCSGGTSSQDLLACQDARQTQLDLSTSIMFDEYATQAQVTSKNAIYASRLERLINNGISVELSEALKTDAALSVSPGDQYNFELGKTMLFCVKNFGESITDW